MAFGRIYDRLDQTLDQAPNQTLDQTLNQSPDQNLDQTVS